MRNVNHASCGGVDSRKTKVHAPVGRYPDGRVLCALCPRFDAKLLSSWGSHRKQPLYPYGVENRRRFGLLEEFRLVKMLTPQTKTSRLMKQETKDFYNCEDHGVSRDFETSCCSIQWSQPCRHFELSDIQLATRNFDELLVIGHGGFGKVYKGKFIIAALPVVVAIKRLDSISNQGATEFWAEVELLSKSRHRNLASLLGYCNNGKEKILVYEYMPNGTLEDHLHKLCTCLSWIQRLKICIGAGRGLEYLHMGKGTEVGVIHRDVKSSNILLNGNWEAKVSDFGLCKLCPSNQSLTYVSTQVKGTFGYLDPDYFYTGRLTRKSDVYAFGVVLLEVLCRKRAVDSSLDEGQWNLATWVQESIKEGNLKGIIDCDIRGEISPKCLKSFVQIVLSCLINNPKHRPTMAKVVVILVSILSLQEKHDSLLQTRGTTLFGKVVDMFAFHSKAVTPAHDIPKLPSNTNSNNMLLEGSTHSTIPSTNLKIFTFADLERATCNFSPNMLLCEGGFGNGFLGWVDKDTSAPLSPGNGTAIVVKELISSSSQGYDKWLAEVTLFRRLAHPNIVRLLGYSDDKIDKYRFLLVYKHTHSRNFGQLIHGGSHESLSWNTRLCVLVGAARGLTYLHSLNLICRGIKSSEILLDQDSNVTLGNFEPHQKQELAQSTIVCDALGHLDPYYIITGNWSVKSDIYGFGVLLLETLTGLQIINIKRLKEQANLITSLGRFLEKERELNEIIDPRLQNNFSKEGAFECIALALECLAKEPMERPSSEDVLRNLENIYFIHK